MHVEGFVGNTHRAWSELDWCFIGVLKNLVMLESKLRACRMTLRLERAVQRTNRTEFAAIIEQRMLPSDSLVSQPSPSFTQNSVGRESSSAAQQRGEILNREGRI